MIVMATSTFHLIGFGFVALMWIVIAAGLIEIARSLRGYLAPHASALYDAVREDRPAGRPGAKRHGAPQAEDACRRPGAGARKGVQAHDGAPSVTPSVLALPLKGLLRAA